MKQPIEAEHIKREGQVTFKVKKRLTVPIISMAHTEQLFCKILAPIESRVIEGFGKGQAGEVKLLRVENLQDHQECDLVVSAVIESTFNQSADYVGRAYLLKAGQVAEGKKYRAIEIYEIEEES